MRCPPPSHSRIASAPGRTSSSPSTRPAPIRPSAPSPEPDSPLRTPFQRDRDRIVHSKSFRRLKHKTQVFVAPEGDHYRTRLTHTLEACGIARTVARALGLNEDLTEAIGLGHDLGHPPFGHAGEDDARRGAARALRRAASSTTSTRCGWSRCWSATATASTSPSRSATASSTTPARPSRRRWRGGSSSWSTASPTSTTTSTTPCAPGSCAPTTCPAAEIELLGPDRLAAHRHPRPRHRRALQRGRRHRPGRGDRRRDAAAAQVHVRPRLPRARRAQREHERVERTMRGLFDHYLEHPDELPALGPGRERRASASPTTSPG